jgi:ATP-binding cassette subfamily F protein uup
MPPVLHLQGIRLSFGGVPLLDGAEIAVSPGERIALVGRNGSGKSTLLKIAAGEIQADGGRRFVQPGLRLSYLPQEPDLSGYATTFAYIEAGLPTDEDPHRARALLADLSVDPGSNPLTLSGGEARRAALARCLASAPEILLLDEPTNHLDLSVIEWLESELAQLRAGMVIISHDKRLLANVTRATVWLDRGATRRLDQGFAAFEAWRDAVLEDEELQRHKLDRRIAMEEDWVRYGVTARRKRNQRRLGELMTMRKQRQEARRAAGDLAMAASEGVTSGKLVFEADRLSKSFGDRVIVRDLSIRVARGDRLAIVGPNGAGKTTLINLLTGELAPDSGTVRLGANLEIATLDQRRASLDPNATVSDALTGGGGDFVTINGQRKHVAGYARDFLFAPEQIRTPVGRLSGGERGRLMLAQALARPSNLLVLDEPTNDLDMETLDLLQELLASYSGTIILVSHDRDFIDHVATSVLCAEGDGRWIEYAGGYTDMVAQRRAGYSTRTVVADGVRPKAERAEAEKRAPSRKLTFNDKRALGLLPGRIESLRASLVRLEERLADADFHARDAAGFAQATADYGAARRELAEAEDEWLRLEMLREEIEA